MDNGIATVKDVKDFFGALVKVEAKEMTDFWKSLGEHDEYTYNGVTYASEKDFYKVEVGKILSLAGGTDKLVENLTSE